ncbi:MAG: hypothetical protein KTR33_03480 [Gammaproteobacteria bacterium]|nr:hypothetical protein [Gammaproteobacteria bacterium]
MPQCSVTFVRFWCISTLTLLMLVAGCSTYRAPDSSSGAVFDNSIAVLGVVSADASLTPFKRNDYVDKLEAQIRAHQTRHTIYPNRDLKRYLARRDGEVDNLSLLLGQYRLSGELTPDTLAILKRQQLPVRYVVLARIESNETRKFRETNNHLRNSRGELLTDRREVALIHQRSVQVSARVYDVFSGRQVWSEYYTSKPEAKNVYVEYTGSSFVGSVATSLANSFVKGRAASRFPAPPREADAVAATFRRIGQRLFKR